MKVAFCGVFGSDNFGNEASLTAAVESLRRRVPAIDLLCICIQPRKAEEIYQLEAVDLNLRALGDCSGSRRMIMRCARRAGLLRVVRTVQAYRHMRGVDALVFPGTGILDDYLLEPSGQPLDMLIWCAIARLRRAKVMFVSVGAGPITHPRSLWFMVKAARTATHRSFRDAASKEFMGSHGLDVSRDRVVPDIVFSLKPESIGPFEAIKRDGLVVGVGVMDYRGWNVGGVRQTEIYRKHVEDTAAIIQSILKRGHCVKIVLGEARDKKAAEDVLERVCAADSIQRERCTAPAMTSFDDVFRELQQCDLVIGTRFHTVVCALILGKPVVSAGYAAKNRSLLEEFGLGEYAHNLETLSPARVIEQLDELIQRRAYLRDSILRKVDSHRATIDTYMESLWDALRATTT